MKRIFTIICMITAAVLLSSCSTTRMVSAEQDFNNYWQGHSYAEIIQAYGAPDRETSDGNEGGVILIYEKSTTTTVTRPDLFYYYYPFGPSYNTTSTTEKQYVHFYVNAAKVCYMVKTNTLREDGKRVDATRTTLAAVFGTLLGVSLLHSIFGPSCYWY